MDSISVPAIIDLESFHQASIRSKDNQKFSPRNLQEMAYLFAEARPLRAMRVELFCQDDESNDGETQALLHLLERERFL